MIVLTRIDDRLIHGQVATQWVAEVSANAIYIIDDETANDEFLAMVCKGLAPLHTNVYVYPAKGAIEPLIQAKNDEYINAIILVKTPDTLLRLIEEGMQFDKIIVGGMGKKDDRKSFYRSIYVSDKEIKEFEEIIAHGIDLQCQIVPSDNSIGVSKLINK